MSRGSSTERKKWPIYGTCAKTKISRKQPFPFIVQFIKLICRLRNMYLLNRVLGLLIVALCYCCAVNRKTVCLHSASFFFLRIRRRLSMLLQSRRGLLTDPMAWSRPVEHINNLFLLEFVRVSCKFASCLTCPSSISLEASSASSPLSASFG